MFHFISGLYSTLFSETELHILIIGHESSGKTTLLEQLRYMYDAKKQKQHHEQKQLQQQQQRSLQSSVRCASDSIRDMEWQRNVPPAVCLDQLSETASAQNVGERADTGAVVSLVSDKKNDTNITPPLEESRSGALAQGGKSSASLSLTMRSVETDIAFGSLPSRPYGAPPQVMQSLRLRPTIGTNILHTTHCFAQYDSNALARSTVTAPTAAESSRRASASHVSISPHQRTHLLEPAHVRHRLDANHSHRPVDGTHTDAAVVDSGMAAGSNAHAMDAPAVRTGGRGEVESVTESSGGESRHRSDSTTTMTNKTSHNSANPGEDALHTPIITTASTTTEAVKAGEKGGVQGSSSSDMGDARRAGVHETSSLRAHDALALPAASAPPPHPQMLKTAAAAQQAQRQRQMVQTPILVWDLGGFSSMRSLWDVYFSQCHAVIFVMDSSLPFKKSLPAPASLSSFSWSEKQQQPQQLRDEESGEQAHAHPHDMHQHSREDVSAAMIASSSQNESCKAVEHLNCEPAALLGRVHPSSTAPHSHRATQPLDTRAASSTRALDMHAVYRDHGVTLRRLFSHPALHHVPFLLLCNTMSQLDHLSLAEMQEALGIADIALASAFYSSATGADMMSAAPAPAADHLHATTEVAVPRAMLSASLAPHSTSPVRVSDVVRVAHDTRDAGQSNSAPHTRQEMHCEAVDASSSGGGGGGGKGSTLVPHDVAVFSVGDVTAGCTSSGFGSITYKLAEVNAFTGEGVAPAMDWLMTQLLRSARPIDDSIA